MPTTRAAQNDRGLLFYLLQWIVSGTLLKAAIAVWMLFICGIILLAYHAYFPPNFSVGFLAVVSITSMVCMPWRSTHTLPLRPWCW